MATEQLIQGKKRYAKPTLSPLTVSGAALLVQRSSASQQTSRRAFARSHNILRVERYTAALLEVAHPLQTKGFSVGWSRAFEGEQVLEIRPTAQRRASPTDYSLLADLRSSRYRAKVVLDRINRACDVAPVAVVLLCQRQNAIAIPGEAEHTECWESPHSFHATELAMLLKSFISLCCAFRKFRLVEGIAHLRIP